MRYEYDLMDRLIGVKGASKGYDAYKDGYDSMGNEVFIHCFQSQSGKVFNVKVKPGWSN